jgi:hypothetical protein
VSAGRSVAATIAGLAAGVVVIVAVEMLGHAIFPLPEGLDGRDPAQMKVLLERMPAAALAFVVGGWCLGVFAGSFVAGLVSRAMVPGMIVGVLLLAATISMFFYAPHPPWMIACGSLLPLPIAWLASRLALRCRASRPSG